jgi:hypothetical protein
MEVYDAFKHPFVLIVPGFLTFAIYLKTSFPSIPGGDAGELLAEACVWGVAHPPGYPIFTLAMSLATSLDQCLEVFSNPALAANVMCCFFGSLAVYFLTLAAYAMDNTNDLSQIVNSMIGPLLFAFSPLVWEYSVGVEVFSLNNVFVALLLFLTVKVLNADKTKPEHLVQQKLYAYCGSLISGLSLCHQHTSLLFIIPNTYAVLKAMLEDDNLCIESMVNMGTGVFLGLGGNMYLHLASINNTPGSWGDLTSWSGFIRHITRAEYGTFSLGVEANSDNSMGGYERTLRWLKDCGQVQFGTVFTIIIIFACGFWCMVCLNYYRTYSDRIVTKQKTLMKLSARTHKALIQAIIFYTVVWNFVFSNLPLDIPMAFNVSSRFWMQPNMIMCLYATAAFEGVCRLLPPFLFQVTSISRYASLRQLRYTVTFLALVGVATRSTANFDDQNRRDAVFNVEYGRAILNSLPPDSVLLAHTDLDWNTARYLRNCENMRPDVVHLNAQLLPYPWFQRQIESGVYGDVKFPDILPGVSTNKFDDGNTQLLRRFLGANTLAHPDNLFLDQQAVNDAEIAAGGVWNEFILVPHGVLYRVMRAEGTLDPADYHKETLAELGKLPRWAEVSVDKYRKGSWEYAALSVVNDGSYQAGLGFLTYALEMGKHLAQAPEILPRYCSLLRRTSDILYDLVLQRGNIETPLSYSNVDLRKNAALAWTQYYQSLQVFNQFKPDDFTQWQIEENTSGVIERVKDKARKIVKVYLEGTGADEQGRQVFTRFLEDLQKR